MPSVDSVLVSVSTELRVPSHWKLSRLALRLACVCLIPLRILGFFARHCNGRAERALLLPILLQIFLLIGTCLRRQTGEADVHALYICMLVAKGNHMLTPPQCMLYRKQGNAQLSKRGEHEKQKKQRTRTAALGRHKHQDLANNGFCCPPYVGPWSQNVRSLLWLSGLLGCVAKQWLFEKGARPPWEPDP